MKVRATSLAAPLLVAALIAGIQFISTAERASLGSCGTVDQEVLAALQGSSQVTVIISLEGPGVPSAEPSVQDMQANTAQRQAAVLAALNPADFAVRYQYETVPALAGLLTAGGADALDCHPDVRSVDLDREVAAHLGESIPLINADQLHAQGIDGTGITVAVLDTGIDTDHPDLADSVIGGACFLPITQCPQFPAHPAEDDFGHGTHVSGIITSNGDNGLAAVGVAPGTGIFAYKVLNSFGRGSFPHILAALNDILTNHEGEFAVINLSLGGGSFSTQPPCDELFLAMKDAFEMLVQTGTLSFASSGNDGTKSAVAYPACLEAVVAVGATYDADLGDEDWPPVCTDPTTSADQVVCFSNSWPALDLLAPGAETLSSVIGGIGEKSGTSMASPHAVGVAALLLDALPGLTPDEVVNRLKSTGALVTDDLFDADNTTNRTSPRVDARVALLTNDADDFDQDGCTNGQEFGATPALGGERNPLHFWDFYDVPVGDPPVRDRRVNVIDMGAVVARFGSVGVPAGDPLSPPPPAPAYHTAFDRGGPYVGVDLWHLRPPNGAINIIDIGAVIIQFGHTCA